MANGFQGQEGQQVPEMTEEIVNGITDRYVELYENIVGEVSALAVYLVCSLIDYIRIKIFQL